MSKFERLLNMQPEGIPSRPAPKKLSAQAYKIPDTTPAPQPVEAPVPVNAPRLPQEDSGTESMSLRSPKPNSCEYIKLTAYISKDTYRAVKRVLLESDQDLSELIEVLLTQWLHSQ